MTTRASGTATRARLLRAAEEIVLREGVARLTLDAVALAAGVSKGGVLYHFATKDALVAAMVEGLVAAFDGDRARAAGVDPGGPGRRTRAFLRASFAPDSPAPGEPAPAAVGAALLAAIATNPDLLDPVRARYAAWQAELERDGIDPALATAARLAADGLVLADLFGLAPPAGSLRERTLAALLRLTEGAGSPAVE